MNISNVIVSAWADGIAALFASMLANATIAGWNTSPAEQPRRHWSK